jgi:hypothetical protein
VWSFAVGKTPEVNPRSGFMTGTPDKPEFFAEQKMHPNEVLKKPLTSEPVPKPLEKIEKVRET